MEPSPSPHSLLTVPQAAKMYGLGVKLVRRAVNEGSFPVYYVGGTWPRVIRSEFEAWVRSTLAPQSVEPARRLHVEKVLSKLGQPG